MGYNEKKKNGVMSISLDTELFWGIHDTQTYESYGQNIYDGRTLAIPRMLEIFKKYHIHATWVIVGTIMAKDKENLMKFLPREQKWPTYDNCIRSSYRLLDDIGQD